jgi:hypothetical protein
MKFDEIGNQSRIASCFQLLPSCTRDVRRAAD